MKIILNFYSLSSANSRGGLFAGATANENVGASASLAGDLSNGFGVGQAEAYVPGARKEVIKTVSTNVATNVDVASNVDVATNVESNEDAKVEVEAPVVVEPESPPQQIPEQSTTTIAPLPMNILPKNPIVEQTTPEQTTPEQTTTEQTTTEQSESVQTTQYTIIQTTPSSTTIPPPPPPPPATKSVKSVNNP